MSTTKMEELASINPEKFQDVFGHYSYVITAKVGDPIYGKAKARLIWAAQTAQACHNLGIKTLLIATASQIPYKVESPQGVEAIRRNLSELYNIDADFDILLLHHPIGEVKQNEPGHYELAYDIPRYVFPRASLVHTRDPKLVSRCIRSKIPFIYEDHDEDHNLDPNIDIKVFDNPLCKGVIAITQSVAERLKMSLSTETGFKIVVCDSGVNQKAFQRQIRRSERWREFLLSENGRSKLVVYSGGMQQERGIEDILRVASVQKELMFAFAGGTEKDIGFWCNYCQTRNVNNVRFLGYLPQAEACSLQQSADVLLSTRANDYRSMITSPLKFFEYMASGSPVVSSRIKALSSHQTEKLAVSWCEPGNVKQLEQLIVETFTRFPRKKNGYSENQEFAKQFTWENRQLKILDYVLGNK